MTYFVFETATVDGARATAITVKDDYSEALMLFHQIRASVLANPKVTYSLTMVIDAQGSVIHQESSGTDENNDTEENSDPEEQ